MNTYTFNFGGVNYSSDDPTTPVSGAISMILTIQAADLDAAKAALASVFASAGELAITGITVIG